MPLKKDKDREKIPSEPEQTQKLEEASALAEISTKIEMLMKSNSDIQKSLTSLELQFQSFKGSVNKLERQYEEVHQAVNEHELRFTKMDQKIDQLTLELSHMKKRVIDLESRSRRKNIRILGLPENTETSDPLKFFSSLPHSLFG